MAIYGDPPQPTIFSLSHDNPEAIPELLQALELALPAASDNAATLQAVQEALDRVNVRWVESAKAAADLAAVAQALSDMQMRVQSARAYLQLADTSVASVADGLRNLRTRLLLDGHKYPAPVDGGEKP